MSQTNDRPRRGSRGLPRPRSARAPGPRRRPARALLRRLVRGPLPLTLTALATATFAPGAGAWAVTGEPCTPAADAAGPPCPADAEPTGGSGSAIGSAVRGAELAAAAESSTSGDGTARTAVVGGLLIIVGAGAVIGSRQTRGRAASSG